MHSSDKRVYFLGDSVYSSLKYCDGFVMEIDPGEYVDSIVSSPESKDIDISPTGRLLKMILVKKALITIKDSGMSPTLYITG